MILVRTLNKHAELFTGLAISAASLISYVMTLAPTVGFIDSGELATVASTLGIAHPTGYPVFTLLSHLFGALPLGLRVITQMNLFAALLCASALFFFFKSFMLIDLLAGAFGKSKIAWNVNNEGGRLLPAALGTLVLGFSETYWSQALVIEVYPLHIVFLSLLIYLFLKGIASDAREKNVLHADDPRMRRGAWYAFAYVLGLSFSNHMTTILLAPGFLYLFFSVNGITRETWRRLAMMSGSFLLGFSIQLFLLIRAGNAPLLNWGNPSSIERFLWHYGGKVYRVWFFSSTESAMKQLSYFFSTLPSEVALLPLIPAVVGAWFLIRSSRRIGLFLLLLFVGCVGYSINYDIHDIDSYFLLAYVAIAMWVTAGARYLIGHVKGGAARPVALGASIALVAILFIYQYPRVDQSRETIVESYTGEILNSVEPNSIIISYQWDYFVSASYYLQHVERLRADVAVIDKELLRRTWYFEQLRHMYPWLIEGVRDELDAFLKELYKFEHDLPYSGAVIEERYRSLIHAIIRSNIGSRQIYITPEIEPEYTSQFSRFPHGLLFRLTPPGIVPAIVEPEFVIPEVARKTKYTDGIRSMYAQGYYFHAQFAFSRGDRERASRMVNRALDIRPDYREAIFLKGKIIPSGD